MAKFSASISRWPVSMTNTEMYGLPGWNIGVLSTPVHTPVVYRETLSGGYSILMTGANFVYDSTTDPGYFWPRSGTISEIAVRDSSGFAMYSWSNLSTSVEAVINAADASDFFNWQDVAAHLMRGNDIVEGSSFDDYLNGYGGNDFIKGSTRNDTIDGGDGIDSAYLRGFKNQYTINHTTTGMITSGLDGTDSLRNIERIRFDNIAVAYDIDGNGGQAYRLYQAALGRTPDLGGLGAQINGLDSGTPLLQISQNFIDSAEFGLKYGANLSNAAFVTQLYANVLHRAPDEGGYAVQLGALNTGMSRAQLLLNFSESTENYQATLVGIQNGIDYVHVG